MASYKELQALNHEIEVLENAGLIKAANVLHKKFVKEAQAQSYVANSGVVVTKPEQQTAQNPPATQPPATTPPPAQTTQPSLPPNYDPYKNYYQDPKTGKIVFIDPRTGQPFNNFIGMPSEMGKGLPITPPGVYQNPGGGTYTVPNPGFNINPQPVQPPAQTVPPINLGIPSYKDRYDFYYGKIDNGYDLPPEQQKAYFDRIKEQLLKQLRDGLIDQKTYDDLMRLFTG